MKKEIGEGLPYHLLRPDEFWDQPKKLEQKVLRPRYGLENKNAKVQRNQNFDGIGEQGRFIRKFSGVRLKLIFQLLLNIRNSFKRK